MKVMFSDDVVCCYVKKLLVPLSSGFNIQKSIFTFEYLKQLNSELI